MAELPPLDDLESNKWNTKIIKIDQSSTDLTNQLAEPAKLLKDGEVVAFPTETVYGLGANALDSNAVSKIFRAKGRPSDNPLIVHISSIDMLKNLVHEDALPKEGSIVHSICKRFWPGPLTILFPRSSQVPNNVTAGLESVGVRMPSHPVARKLIEICGLPLAAPSANLSGKPSPTIAEHVIQDLKGRIPCIIDGGAAQVGVESTVIDIFRSPPLILRPGGVTLEQLREYVSDIQVYEKKVHGTALESQPPTPGLKYRHYSPSTKVVLFEENNSFHLQSALIDRISKEVKDGKRVAIIQTHPNSNYPFKDRQDIILYPLGDNQKPESVAQGIFKALRDLDEQKVDVILIEGISENQEGLAVMNRIRKAASEIIHKF